MNKLKALYFCHTKNKCKELDFIYEFLNIIKKIAKIIRIKF